jgi:hypothetical protein
MADRNIELKLSIDGKEAIATLNLTDEKLKEIFAGLSAPKKLPPPIDGKDIANVSSMNTAIGQFGFLLGDADMFMVNFRMGMMSVANNIPMVVQMLQYARDEALKAGISMKDAFMQSIKGPGGIMLAVNGAMLAIQLLTRAFSENTKEVKKDGEEVKNLTEKYKNLSTVILDAQKNALQKRKTDLEDLIKLYNKVGTVTPELKQKGFKEITDEEIDKLPSTNTLVNKKTLLYKWIFGDEGDKEKRTKEFRDELKALKTELDVLANADLVVKEKVSQIMKGTFDISTPNRLTEAIKLLTAEHGDMTKAESAQIEAKTLQLKKLQLERDQNKPLKDSNIITTDAELQKKKALVLIELQLLEKSDLQNEKLNERRKLLEQLAKLNQDLGLLGGEKLAPKKDFEFNKLTGKQITKIAAVWEYDPIFKIYDSDARGELNKSITDFSGGKEIFPIWEYEPILKINNSNAEKNIYQSIIDFSGEKNISADWKLKPNVKIDKTDIPGLTPGISPFQKLDISTKIGDGVDMTKELGSAWQRTGSIMSNALGRALGLMNQTENVLVNILQLLGQMALEIATSLLTKFIGLELGLPMLSVSGPSPFAPVSIGSAPLDLNLNVSGNTKLHSRYIEQSFDSQKKLKAKYY